MINKSFVRGGIKIGLVDNKFILVTGGAQGMGASHVRKLVDEVATVMISDILVDKGEALVKELGEKVKFVELDVTKRDAWDNAIIKTEEAFGPIDVLVNNAEIDIMKKFIEFTEDELQKILEVNLFSQFHGMQKVLPSMKKLVVDQL